VFERFEQLLATALGGAAAVGAHRHQHDRVPRQHPPDAVIHPHRPQAMALGAVGGEAGDLRFGHAGVVLQLQGLQRRPCRRDAPHPADEMGFGGGGLGAAGRQAPLPGGQRDERIEGFRVQLQLQGAGVGERISHRLQPPLIGGRKATSAPGASGW